MTELFHTDQADIKKLIKAYKQLPRVMHQATASTLNSMAFEDRAQIPKTMDDDMIIRTPSLIKRATRVQMTKGNIPTDRQIARSGSIETPRHDAWAHVQEGQATRATQFTSEGRAGGTSAGKAKKQAKAGQAHTNPKDIRTKRTGQTRITAYLQRIKRDKTRRRKSIYIPKGHRRLPKGIYKFVGGRVRKGNLIGASIVRLSTPGARIKPDKFDWKNEATRRALPQNKVVDIYQRNAKKEINKLKGRVGL